MARGATRRTTLKDVADRLGVSKAAVSFALNGRDGVSEELREHIRSTAAQMGYRPNSAALALGSDRVGVVGLVINRPTRSLGIDQFFPQLMGGLQAGLADGVGLQILIVSSLAQELDAYRDWAAAHRVDGVVLVDPLREDPRLSLLRELALPAVQIGSHPAAPGEPPSVWIDDDSVATQLFGLALRTARGPVAHVSGPPEFEHTALRSEALLRLAERRGQAVRIVPTDYSASSGARATHELLTGPTPPEVIVYDNDVLALAGLRVAQELGVEVPTRLALASFDDSVALSLVKPSITALTRDTHALGELAARTLGACIDGGPDVPSAQAPTPLFSLRESTGLGG